MVTFGTRENYKTESIVFDITKFDLPYNGILGRPALAKFMAVSHYAYLTNKIPGPRGPITVPADLQSSVLCIEKFYEVAAASTTNEMDGPECSGLTLRRVKLSSNSAASSKEVPLSNDPAKTVKIDSHLAVK